MNKELEGKPPLDAEKARAITIAAREKAASDAEEKLLMIVVAIEMRIEREASEGKCSHSFACKESDEVVAKIQQSFTSRGFEVTVEREKENGYAQIKIFWM